MRKDGEGRAREGRRARFDGVVLAGEGGFGSCEESDDMICARG